MANVGGDPAVVASSFPLPPPFYKLYGQTSVDTNSADGPASTSGRRPPDPPVPPKGQFTVFGQTFDPAEPQVPPLQGHRLFEQQPDGSVDFKAELQQLHPELLFLFLELLRSLVEDPGAYAPKLNAMNQVMGNMQHLLNMMRPQQARATLEYALQEQVKQKQKALASLRAQTEAADRLVASTAAALTEASAAALTDQ